MEDVRVNGIKEPIEGERPNFSPDDWIWDRHKFDIKAVKWFDEGLGRYMEADETFKNGNYYTLEFAIIYKNGYYVSISRSATFVNDKLARNFTHIEGYNRQYPLRKFTFGVKNNLKHVYVTGLTEPVDGQTPDYDISKLTYDKKRYAIYSVDWYAYDHDGEAYIMDKDQKFVFGQKYSPNFKIAVSDTQRFAGANFTINEEDAAYAFFNGVWNMSRKFVAKKDADKNYIDKLSVIIPDECLPVDGEEPIWDVSRYTLVMLRAKTGITIL